MTDTATFATMCSGIDGMGIGLERAGFSLRWQAENDAYCSRVLATRWPGIPNFGDIKNVDWSTVEPVDLICAGYPCQPFSFAGLRAGADDPRHLWPFVFDAVRILRPRRLLLENVPGHLSLGFDRVLADLATIGFDAQWSLVPACAVGASHTRPRLFVLAYPQGADEPGEMSPESQPQERWAESRGGRLDESRPGRWIPEPDVDRMADGVPRRLVYGPLAALGNAVVPPVAEWIGRRIMATAGAGSETIREGD